MEIVYNILYFDNFYVLFLYCKPKWSSSRLYYKNIKNKNKNIKKIKIKILKIKISKNIKNKNNKNINNKNLSVSIFKCKDIHYLNNSQRIVLNRVHSHQRYMK